MNKSILSSVKIQSIRRLFVFFMAMCWVAQGVCHTHNMYLWDSSSWYYDFQVDGFYYRFISHQEVMVCHGSDGYSGVVRIPKEVEYTGEKEYMRGIYSVIAIGNAFFDCSDVTEVYIPSSVTDISSGAFRGCTNLKRIVVEEGNPCYDSREDCNAIIRTYETGAETKQELIAGCKNTYIPNGVTSIGYSAFSGCTGLKKVTIPSSVTSIGSNAFNGCTDLERIVVEGGNAYYDSREDCNAIIRTNTNELIFGCKNTFIPNSITSIASSAFKGCIGLTGKLTIPNGVTSIGSSAFEGCTGLTGDLTIPNSVTSIGASAFEECSSLTELTIGSGVTSIGNHAFLGCSSLEKIVVDADNRYYDSREDCNAIIHTYGTVVTLVAGCKNAHIPNGVTIIDDHAFYGCTNLTKVHIPNSVTSISDYAFECCSNLTDLIIGSGVTSIGWGAFYECSGLVKVHIPNSVTSIDGSAFSHCDNLIELILGNSVNSIGSWAFNGCLALVSVTSLNLVPPAIESNTFEWMTTKNATLHVSEGCKRTYWTLPYWEEFVNVQDDVTDGIESICADKHNKVKIYTLGGKQLQTSDVSNLPKSIYIVNGKKYVVK